MKWSKAEASLGTKQTEERNSHISFAVSQYANI
jgi:hypothetical protein